MSVLPYSILYIESATIPCRSVNQSCVSWKLRQSTFISFPS